MDLNKAFNKVKWTFLRLVLLHIGLGLEVTNWIMGCVTSTNFSISINGFLTSNFSSSGGLRQGLMSPLLSMLMMESLSLLLLKEKQERNVKGIKISYKQYITHLVFVHDAL